MGARRAGLALAVAVTVAGVLAAAATPGAAASAPATADTTATVSRAGPLSAAQHRMLLGWLQARAAEADLPAAARVEVELGAADPRLRLAPCARAAPYLPAASRPWGRTRVGLRCVDGAVAWHVSLPATVRVLAPAPVLRAPLPAGSRIEPAQLARAEIDWADAREPPLADAAALQGRILARPLSAGAPLRPADLQPLRWFDAGARVRVDAVGRGWRVSGAGQALQAGLDGRRVRVRTEGGRIVTGIAVATNRVEVAL